MGPVDAVLAAGGNGSGSKVPTTVGMGGDCDVSSGCLRVDTLSLISRAMRENLGSTSSSATIINNLPVIDYKIRLNFFTENISTNKI